MPLTLALRRQFVVWLKMGFIGAIVLTMAGAFAYTAGWLSPQRLTPQRLVDTFEATGGIYPGYRRAHAEGICVSGEFQSSGMGATLSHAAVFTAGATTPVLGRLAVAGEGPHQSDAASSVRSMALRLTSIDGQEWRTGMNSTPFNSVSTPQGLYDETLASRPDPATGKPDPERLRAFTIAHPESRPFQKWLDHFIPSDSYANTRFYSVNAFMFTNAVGIKHFVRWEMRPETGYSALPQKSAQNRSRHFLRDDVQQRLTHGPLRWRLLVTVAAVGDPVDDSTQAWPATRAQIDVGTLVIHKATAQANGACRDLNFDPLVLPAGIEGSLDPVLRARSAAYAVSYNRRIAEQAASLKGAS